MFHIYILYTICFCINQRNYCSL